MKNKENLLKELNIYLANLNILNVKLHNYHWNIQGRGFFELHSKFEELYNKASEDLDQVAERMLILGSRPAASMKDYLQLSTMEEKSSEGISSLDAVKALKEDYNLMYNHSMEIINLAEESGDPVTADMMTDFAADYEKTLWMIRAYLG
ncbi:Dps family protein [Clostridium polynesiense]|uniref:Dps family protein n=1 Tax=Clostridium polynesiense TaxID=1325933 RepID=UPI00058C1B56|nr:DNA starvation/stationary phase protection protein [Clostridium polynesiense]